MSSETLVHVHVHMYIEKRVVKHLISMPSETLLVHVQCTLKREL